MIFKNATIVSTETLSEYHNYEEFIVDNMIQKMSLEIKANSLFEQKIIKGENGTKIELKTVVYSPEQINEILNKLLFLETQIKDDIYIHSQIEEIINLIK